MKRTTYMLIAFIVALLAASCDDYETYADKKKKERSAISHFIADSAFQIISEAQFNQQNQTTDVSKKQFVYLEKSGIYMQIQRKGCGEPIADGATKNVLCRFLEYNILDDTLLVRNDARALFYDSNSGQYIDASQYVDKMTVQRSGSTYTAYFISGMMYTWYSSASVPTGWLVPLNYINVGRPASSTDETAMVRLIVPHSQGTATASQNVYPCYYEISYELGN